MVDIAEKLTGFLDHFISITGSDGTDESEASFSKEFQTLKLESQEYKDKNVFPADSGQLPINKKKNRFKDILPFEYTRVQLHKMEGIEGSDYINANYIQGPDGNVSYIAAQGPLPHTVDDFWRMLWYHQIEIVVMACREVEMAKPKCQAYWPPVGESAFFGAIKVTTNHEEQISEDYIIREMTAECQGEEQIVRQFHYTAWPDHGRPESATPIIRMIENFRDHRKRHDIPFVVHCSAGCGRTGTIIAIDFARTMLLSEQITNEFSVYTIVHSMRQQRPAMVQALDQYVFVYMAVVELVQRQLTNVPLLPPKMLKFEKEASESALVTVTTGDDNLYENVTKMMSDSHLETIASTQSSSSELAPPTKPRPLSRSLSGERPHPPPKPAKKPPVPEPVKKPLVPEPAKKPLVPEPVKKPLVPEPFKKPLVPEPAKKPPVPEPAKRPLVPEPAKRPLVQEKSNPPIPVPRKPVKHDDGPVLVPRRSPNPGEVPPRLTSTPTKTISDTSITSTDHSISKSSILETLIAEVGDEIIETHGLMEVGGKDIRAPDYTYATLGVKDTPPEIPLQTSDSTQLTEAGVSPLYETADLTTPAGNIHNHPPRSVSPSSSSLAFSVATMRPTDVKPTKAKKFSSDDPAISHAGVSKTISTSPRKAAVPTPAPRQVAPPITSGGSANTKYTFPGDFGYGIRVGKPKGPRPVPSHWNILNGITH